MTDSMRIGLSQASARVGRGVTHALRVQRFDFAAALFGAPARPDAGWAMMFLPATIVNAIALQITRLVPLPGRTHGLRWR